MKKNIEEILAHIKSQNLSNDELTQVAYHLLSQVVVEQQVGESEQSKAREERYQFAKERIVKSKAAKVKSLRNTLMSYFRGREGGVSKNEVDKIVERLVGEKIIFINASDDVEYL